MLPKQPVYVIYFNAVNLKASERGLRETTESYDGGNEIKRGTQKDGTIFTL